jgi:5-methylcytosine-specific restriction protein B
MPNHWWVNQGRTYEVQHTGGYLFASSGSSSGKQVPSWEALKDMLPDDTVFHYSEGLLRALGKVTAPAEMTAHPGGEREGADVNADLGYRVSVEYHAIEPPIPLDDIPLELRDPKLGPFTKGKERVGVPQQGYAFPLKNGFVLDFKKAFPDRLPIDPW